MIKRIRTWAVVIGNTLVAVLGTAVLESPLARIVHPHTGVGVIWREWITSIIIAGALGFAVQRYWKNGGARWSWILPSVFFVPVMVFVGLGSGHVAARLSGRECAAELGGPGCWVYLMCTIPFVRGIAYSAAAALAGRTDTSTGVVQEPKGR
jgi:hypothetical protein